MRPNSSSRLVDPLAGRPLCMYVCMYSMYVWYVCMHACMYVARADLWTLLLEDHRPLVVGGRIVRSEDDFSRGGLEPRTGEGEERSGEVSGLERRGCESCVGAQVWSLAAL